MTAERFRAGNYTRQNKTDDQEKGNFCSPGRVTVTEGTRPQTRSKAVEAPQLGNIHRNTVDRLEQPPEGHRYTSMHRPEPSTHSPSSPVDLGGLRSHQERMLTDRQKKRNKGSK